MLTRQKNDHGATPKKVSASTNIAQNFTGRRAVYFFLQIFDMQGMTEANIYMILVESKQHVQHVKDVKESHAWRKTTCSTWLSWIKIKYAGWQRIETSIIKSARQMSEKWRKSPNIEHVMLLPYVLHSLALFLFEPAFGIRVTTDLTDWKAWQMGSTVKYFAWNSWGLLASSFVQ